MKNFQYKVKDELGLHARPAGLLVKFATGFKSSITIAKEGKTADAKRLFGVMGLAVKQHDTLTFTVEGEDEAVAATDIKNFCENNF